MNDTDLLALAVDLAQQAAKVILAVRTRGFETMAKGDKSPVTEADHAAEALIVAGLRQATPDIPVIAEEEVAAGRITKPCPLFWLVDPLDGTREFAAGHDEFTVNVGLVRNGAPALGAVGVPAYGETFSGIVGTGAWKQTDAGARAIHVRQPPEEGVTVYASRHYGSEPKLQTFLAGRRVARVLHVGSAVKFCRLAEGVGDVYPRFGRTMEWDTAAPQAVLEAAGGSVREFSGAKLPYGKPGWANPPFLCLGATDALVAHSNPL